MTDSLTSPVQGNAEERGARSVSNRRGKRNVAKPPVGLQVGSYNIGWSDTQLSGENHEMHWKQLGRDCASRRGREKKYFKKGRCEHVQKECKERVAHVGFANGRVLSNKSNLHVRTCDVCVGFRLGVRARLRIRY